MKTFAFKSKLENNKVPVPEHLFAELEEMNNREVRVILLMEEPDEFDDEAFNDFASQFFSKYANNLDAVKKLLKNIK